MSGQDTPRTTRSGRVRLNEEEEEKASRKIKSSRKTISSQSSSDSEVDRSSNSEEFVSASGSAADRELSSNLENISFTDKPSDINLQEFSSSTNFPSTSKQKESESDSKNSLDALDKDPQSDL